MYLFKKITIKFIKKNLILILNKLILVLFLISFFINTNTYALTIQNQKYIGFIESLNGKADTINKKDLVQLNEFDQIFVNQVVKIKPNSNITISFIDNSILTLEGDSEFIVEKFDPNLQKPEFLLSIPKGKFTFESGSISKNKLGIMKIILSEMEVSLKGTLVTGANTEANKKISLVEDSLGNIGALEVTIGEETTTISEPSAGISLSANNETQNTKLSNEETEQVKNDIKEAAITSSTQSEENIERAITKQLANGTIPDSNGDGVADLADVEAYKAELLGLKQLKLEYVVEQSKDDLSLLSEIIVNSDSDQSMDLMENMMQNNAENASLLMTEIVDQNFDIFSHVSNAQTGNFENLRESIVTEMIQDESDFVADTMAQMMAVGNTEMGAYMMNEITNTQTEFDNQRNLAMDVLATFTEVASDKMDTFMQTDPNMMGKFTQSAFANADEGDSEMIADMMQQTSGKNSAYLMSSMMENNNTMITSVYENLAEQDFDIFNHIETAKMNPTTTGTDPFFPTPENDPYLPTPGTDIFTPGDDPTNMMASQTNFYDDLKGQIFSEIINNSDQTAAEATAELMMNSEGDSAMFMMETMMETNPEMIGNVMQNFVEDDFDIFDHFEDTAIDEPTSSASLDAPSDNEINDPAVGKSKKGLTKEERIAAKAEKKAEKARIKAIRKAAKLVAKQAAQEIGFTTPIETNPDLQEFKAEVFQDMMTYSDDSTMETMAKLVVGADEQTASLIFETVVSEQNNIMAVDGAIPKDNFALDLMNNLSTVDSGMMNKMYETQGDLVNNMMSTAMVNISAEDSGAIANIISSSGNDSMNEMVFNNIASSNDQSLTSNVFTTLADSATGTDAIISMASTNQSLYENMAQDVDSTYMTAASLYTNTTAEYATDATTAATATATNTTTYAAGAISWTTYPMSSATYSTNSYISITGTATSMNGVTYSASDLPDGLTIDYTSGLIFGTPTSAGNWNSTITATDMMDFNSFATASLPFSIIQNVGGGYNAAGGGYLSFMSTPYPPATLTVNSAITPIYLYTTGGTGNITYTPTGLPMGLYISAGSIIGTPSAQTFTSSSVTIIATDQDGNTASTSLNFPQVNSSGGGGGSQYGPTWSSYTYVPATLTKGTQMMDMFLDATGTGPLSFVAKNLPQGLYVSGSYIKGTPMFQTYGSSSVEISATDSNGTQTKYFTFPQVNASGGGGSGPTWTTPSAPASLQVGSAMTSITLSATGMNPISYSEDGNLASLGLTLAGGIITGTPTTTTATATTVVLTATDMMMGSTTTSVTFPMVSAGGGAETITFDTAETLPSAGEGGNINETITATASLGSIVSYNFISATNTGNSAGLGGTNITVTGNVISGIAPRLLNAATYSFKIQASINAGSTINNKTFKLLISKAATCVSPTNNICT